MVGSRLYLNAEETALGQGLLAAKWMRRYEEALVFTDAMIARRDQAATIRTCPELRLRMANEVQPRA